MYTYSEQLVSQSPNVQNASPNIWRSPLSLFQFCVVIIKAANAHNACVHRRKKKWRNKGSCTNSPGSIIAALQRWSCRWSAPAKVVLLVRSTRRLCLLSSGLWLLPLYVGETGPMVTTTLKLGISILNGGNSEVQRVCVLKIKQRKVTPITYGLLSFPFVRKCWNTWGIRRMLASFWAFRPWCRHAGQFSIKPHKSQH